MAKQKRIFLYGRSVIIGSVGASLERGGQFEVIQLTLPLPAPSELDAMAPDVVVFDTQNSHPGPAFSLLETRPGLLLLGISPDGDVVRLWSRRQYRALSTRDLAALIEDASHSSAPQEGPYTTPERGKEV